MPPSTIAVSNRAHDLTNDPHNCFDSPLLHTRLIGRTALTLKVFGVLSFFVPVPEQNDYRLTIGDANSPRN
jgi:hypothetical protein